MEKCRKKRVQLVKTSVAFALLAMGSIALQGCFPFAGRVYKAEAEGGRAFEYNPRLATRTGVKFACGGIEIGFTGSRGLDVHILVPEGHTVHLPSNRIQIEERDVVRHVELQFEYLESINAGWVNPTPSPEGGLDLVGATELAGKNPYPRNFHASYELDSNTEDFRLIFPTFEVDGNPCVLPTINFSPSVRIGIESIN